MKNFKNYIYILAAFAALASCRPKIDGPTPTRGTADFTRYISVGNSLTAGYSNGGLYLAGQQNSYPSIIATQMQAAGGGSFSQPLFDASQANGTGYLHLKALVNGSPVLDTIQTNLAIRGTSTAFGLAPFYIYTKYTGALENYGVPGIKLNDIQNPYYGDVNPFFERMFSAVYPAITTTYLDFVTAKSFTFFTNWLGNNDALAYATSGGAGDVLTDKNVFNATYSLLVARLTASGAKGVCATIPDVTTIPYFTTVTVPLVLASVQAKVPTVQALYINALVSGSTYVPRVATANDLIVLTFPTSKIGTGTASNPYPYGLDPRNPIENKYVLDANEAAMVKDYVLSYNNSIKLIAASKGLGVFDAYTFLTNLKNNGLTVNGVNLSSAYISGGVFSLDGVHLTPRGYAIVANEMIKVINSTYGSTLSGVNIANYNGVTFP